MSKLIIANWKMNPSSVGEAVKLAKKEDFKGAVIAPPFVFLESVGKVLKQAKLGAQDIFWKKKGAYTGEISINMLKSLKVKYVIIGHSERRALGETDEMINKKLIAALQAEIIPILCVGEPLSIRKRGLTAAKIFVKNQLIKDLSGLSKVKGQRSKVIIAYEPIWAISTNTGIPDNPQSAAEMHKFIKNFINSKFKIQNSKLLYGGSVNSKNIESFLKNPEIDGALVGGASLKTIEFKIIVKIASNSAVL